MRVQALPHFRAERPVFGGLAETLRRVRVWWLAPELDRQLAEGSHPWTSQELSQRARQLTSPDRRARLARELESVVDEARRGHGKTRPCVPLRRAEARAAAVELLALAGELQAARHCTPRSAGLVSYLLYDPCSPLYYDEARPTIDEIARAARTGLDRGSVGDR
jgi:hypothetical protein